MGILNLSGDDDRSVGDIQTSPYSIEICKHKNFICKKHGVIAEYDAIYLNYGDDNDLWHGPFCCVCIVGLAENNLDIIEEEK